MTILNPQLREAVEVHAHDKAMTSEETAEYLSLSTWTLQVWRRKGFGPPYIRLRGKNPTSGSIRYKKSSVDKWLADREVDCLAQEYAGAEVGGSS
jgi:hypothetical protein